MRKMSLNEAIDVLNYCTKMNTNLPYCNPCDCAMLKRHKLRPMDCDRLTSLCSDIICDPSDRQQTFL